MIARHPGIYYRDNLSMSRGAIHQWLRKHSPKVGRCDECGRVARTQFAFLRHPEPYTRDRADYAELCVPCHKALDGGGARHAQQ